VLKALLAAAWLNIIKSIYLLDYVSEVALCSGIEWLDGWRSGNMRAANFHISLTLGQ
jgi:hypothetical protein